jgi:hypothetical protein
MTQRDRSECTSIWIRGCASPATDRARVAVELIRPGRPPEAHDVELLEGECRLDQLLELIT